MRCRGDSATVTRTAGCCDSESVTRPAGATDVATDWPTRVQGMAGGRLGGRRAAAPNAAARELVIHVKLILEITGKTCGMQMMSRPG